MEWKQPVGLRRHWVLEELDAEILFLPMPVDAAQGRVVDDVYELRDGGVLRKRRTISADGVLIATLEQKAAGSGGILRMGDREFVWKSTSPMNTRWILEDSENNPVFTFTLKAGIVKVAKVDVSKPETEGYGALLLLCWYVTVL